MHRLIRRFVTLAFVACSTIAVAAPVTIPHTFTAGTPANAAHVNANFQALVTAINTLSDRVDRLDGTTPVTAADVVGTYTLSGLMVQVFIDGVSTARVDHVASGAMSGTVIFNADGTGSNTISMNVSQMNMPKLANVASTVVTGPQSLPVETFTWTLTGNTMTTSTGLSMRVQSGERVFAGTTFDAINGVQTVFVVMKN